MNFNSIDEIFTFAINAEKQAVEFYTELAGTENFAAIKEALLEFAKEEKKHQTMLEEFSAKKETLAGYTYKWIPDMKRSDYLTEMEYEPGMSYPDILRIAMKREENALKMYNELATKTEDDACINLFKLLCQEEAKHKSYFETVYDDYMAEQGD